MTQITDEMAKLRKTFKDATNGLIQHRDMLKDQERQVLAIRKKIEHDVVNAVKPGTTMQVFTNEMQRSAEIFKRLQEDETFKKHESLRDFELDEIANINAEREICYFDVKTYDIESREF